MPAAQQTSDQESATELKERGASAAAYGGAVQAGSGDSAQDLEAAVILSGQARKTIEIATGFAPFVTTGDSSEFFKIGYLTELYLTFCLNLPVGQLGLGVQFGVNIFNTQGLVSSTENLLIPMGIDIRYVYGQGMPMGLFLHLDGGPAILIVDSEYWGRQVKVVPYVKGGIGLMLPFAHFMGMAFDFSYNIYFESSVFIMGFTPALNMYFSL